MSERGVQFRLILYSCRNAAIGSIRTASAAGRRLAHSATDANSPDCREQAPCIGRRNAKEKTLNQSLPNERTCAAKRASDQRHGCRFRKNQASNLKPSCSKRHSESDLIGSLRDGECQDPVKADHR
jgi:hypothetical protein